MAAHDQSSSCHFQTLNSDLVSEIMTRLDGSALAAVGSTCSDLKHSVSDQSLWRRLCHSTWPSTSSSEGQRVIPDFAKFYASSSPFVAWDEGVRVDESCSRISGSDLTSFVDVHYKGKSVFSTVVNGVNVNEDNDASYNWFANCPFKLDLLGFKQTKIAPEESDVYNPKQHGDLLEKLAKEVTLSWVMFDTKKGKTVNLSSGLPLKVSKNLCSSEEEYVMSFGCIVPIEESIVPCKLVECIITAKCTLAESSEAMRMTEISMSIVDLEGSHVNGKTSLIVLNRALHSPRTNQTAVIERGFKRFQKLREEIKKRKDCRESFLEKICASVEVAVFLGMCYGCNAIF